jgi:hypothetical protein
VVAPSILAASAKDLGILLKCCLNKNIPNADPKNGNIIPNFVFNIPNSLSTIKFGVIKTSFGTIICINIITNTIATPLKSITANA